MTTDRETHCNHRPTCRHTLLFTCHCHTYTVTYVCTHTHTHTHTHRHTQTDTHNGTMMTAARRWLRAVFTTEAPEVIAALRPEWRGGGSGDGNKTDHDV